MDGDAALIPVQRIFAFSVYQCWGGKEGIFIAGVSDSTEQTHSMSASSFKVWKK